MRVIIVGNTGIKDAVISAPFTDSETPVLFVKKDSIPMIVEQELIRLNPSEILVFGGTLRVGLAVIDQLATLAPVTRIAGPTVYATAIAASQFMYPVITPPPPVVVPPVEPPPATLTTVPGWQGAPIWGKQDPAQLTPWSADHRFKTATTINGVAFNDQVLVDGVTVTFNRCYFPGGQWYGVKSINGGRAIVSESTFDGGLGRCQFGITGNAEVYRSYFKHLEDAVKMGWNSLYTQCYIEELGYSATSHEDGFQSSSGTKNTVIEYNHIRATEAGRNGALGGTTSCIIIKSDSGQQDGITVRGNVMLGGGYTLYIRDGGNGNPKNIHILDNVFLGAVYGNVSHKSLATTWSGNTNGAGEEV